MAMSKQIVAVIVGEERLEFRSTKDALNYHLDRLLKEFGLTKDKLTGNPISIIRRYYVERENAAGRKLDKGGVKFEHRMMFFQK